MSQEKWLLPQLMWPRWAPDPQVVIQCRPGPCASGTFGTFGRLSGGMTSQRKPECWEAPMWNRQPCD